MEGIPFLGKGKKTQEYAFGHADRVDEAYEIARTVRGKKYRYIRNYLPHLPLIQDNFYTDQSEIMKELRKIKAAGNFTPAQKSMWLSRRDAEELYEKKRYAAAQRKLGDFLENERYLRGDDFNDLHVNARYMQAVSQYHLEQSDAALSLTQFAEEFPENTKAMMAYYYLGNKQPANLKHNSPYTNCEYSYLVVSATTEEPRGTTIPGVKAILYSEKLIY